MQVTVEIPNEAVAQAKAQGLAVETYVQSLVEQAQPPTGDKSPRRRWTREEMRAWLDEMAQFSDEIPAMPGETFSREMIYQDHD
jgi:hypothetical protein